MVDAPERLWVQPENRTPIDEDPRHAGPHDVEYVRADLYEQVKRERDDAKQALRNEIVAHGNTIRGKAERLAGARVVTDAMVAAFQDKYREFWKGSWPDTETSRELLRAALAEPAGNVEPVACVACEDSPKGENNPCAVCGKAATPPDASARRGALEAALETMKRYKRAGYGDDVFMSDLCRSIRTAEAALTGAKP